VPVQPLCLETVRHPQQLLHLALGLFLLLVLLLFLLLVLLQV
jgi:hypothetical protein